MEPESFIWIVEFDLKKEKEKNPVVGYEGIIKEFL